MLKLYQTEWCYYCARVRAKMTDLGITYINVNVPAAKEERKELLEISGQAGIPTLVTEDGQVIADDDDAIIAYLEENYGSRKM
ncbi:MAG TPA: glutathione S-transferase N-terminal domain-containing protein [Armatimonadota bacterium]|mgnify:FL=1|nr:glutathione S-transferase N-terminal domain-containing protein [Armatimonadota bacterium]HOM72724.1 glutathione S-transferase N-terminal domain-containing protein [Armatimonadota bacterium]